nr:MAG TPA: hypothetical protein [Caudoviricetes sp.]
MNETSQTLQSHPVFWHVRPVLTSRLQLFK